MTDPKPRRYGLQLRRALLVLLTLACVWFGWQMDRVDQRHKAVARILEMGGGVIYDDQFDGEGNPIADMSFVTRTSEPESRSWRRDLFHHVVCVGLHGTEASDLTPLANLTHLEQLYCGDTQVSDLTPLAKLTSLKTLELPKTPVSDVTPLLNLRNLEWLDLAHTQVTDVGSLARLKSLQYLYLRNTTVSKEETTQLRQAIPNCHIDHHW